MGSKKRPAPKKTKKEQDSSSEDSSSEDSSSESAPPTKRARVSAKESDEMAKTYAEKLLPKKSKLQYEEEWDKFASFIKWGKQRKTAPKEAELVRYVTYLLDVKKNKRSSVSSYYCRLSGFILAKYNIKCKTTYPRVAMLISNAPCAPPKQSKTLTDQQLEDYCTNGPLNGYHLVRRAYLATSYSGALRAAEAKALTLKDVDASDEGNIKVTIIRLKSKNPVSFTFFLTNWAAATFLLYLNYINDEHDLIELARNECLWIRGEQDEDGPVKFSECVVGVNTLRQIPSVCARWLNLKNPELYTGHCARKSAAQSLYDKETPSSVLKDHCGWSSESMIQTYAKSSDATKKTVADRLTQPPAAPPQAPQTAQGSVVINLNFGDILTQLTKQGIPK